VSWILPPKVLDITGFLQKFSKQLWTDSNLNPNPSYNSNHNSNWAMAIINNKIVMPLVKRS
jgi:hypothetical protein